MNSARSKSGKQASPQLLPLHVQVDLVLGQLGPSQPLAPSFARARRPGARLASQVLRSQQPLCMHVGGGINIVSVNILRSIGLSNSTIQILVTHKLSLLRSVDVSDGMAHIIAIWRSRTLQFQYAIKICSQCGAIQLFPRSSDQAGTKGPLHVQIGLHLRYDVCIMLAG